MNDTPTPDTQSPDISKVTQLRAIRAEYNNALCVIEFGSFQGSQAKHVVRASAFLRGVIFETTALLKAMKAEEEGSK